MKLFVYIILIIILSFVIGFWFGSDLRNLIQDDLNIKNNKIEKVE